MLYFRQQHAYNFVNTIWEREAFHCFNMTVHVCTKWDSVSSWSGKWWVIYIEPGLIIQHQCLTLLILLGLNWSKSLQPHEQKRGGSACLVFDLIVYLSVLHLLVPSPYELTRHFITLMATWQMKMYISSNSAVLLDTDSPVSAANIRHPK